MSRWLAFAFIGTLCACGAATDQRADTRTRLSLDPSCNDRKGGAFITFQMDSSPSAAAEQFTVWSVNGSFIDSANAALNTGDRRTPMFDKVLAGGDCDPAYHWHVDPAAMSFTDFATEVCDGRPSYLEANLSQWITAPGNYCPWGVTVVNVDDRR
jgi:hypothetical protein